MRFADQIPKNKGMSTICFHQQETPEVVLPSFPHPITPSYLSELLEVGCYSSTGLDGQLKQINLADCKGYFEPEISVMQSIQLPHRQLTSITGSRP